MMNPEPGITPEPQGLVIQNGQTDGPHWSQKSRGALVAQERAGEYSLLHCHLPESFMSKGRLWGRGEGEGGPEGREAGVCQMEMERQF